MSFFEMCPYCELDTAGNHKAGCPNSNITIYGGSGQFIHVSCPQEIDLSGVTNQALLNVQQLQAELVLYKEQAKRIPDICYRESCLNCGLRICPKHKPLPNTEE